VTPPDTRDRAPPDVARALVLRIALLGGESSGKTTLASGLAERFRTVWVPEFGRELWERQGGTGSETDLLTIAEVQAAREDEALTLARAYLFCDTTPLTTAGYGLWTFGRIDPVLGRLAKRAYDGVILCLPDIPFVQDGARRDTAFRTQQHEWYRQQLREVGSPVLEVGGSIEQRIAEVERWLPTLRAGSGHELGT
jgi:NadR type nicotinamide-nucleotide adenylyltransferase